MDSTRVPTGHDANCLVLVTITSGKHCELLRILSVPSDNSVSSLGKAIAVTIGWVGCTSSRFRVDATHIVLSPSAPCSWDLSEYDRKEEDTTVGELEKPKYVGCTLHLDIMFDKKGEDAKVSHRVQLIGRTKESTEDVIVCLGGARQISNKDPYVFNKVAINKRLRDIESGV
ncbi:hypothetical protein MMC06_001657 [Schaereria dolodes]|nr:hypothetical protein [Schaereria dolodes]